MRIITTKRSFQISSFNQLDISVTTEVEDELYDDVKYRRMVYSQQLLDIENQYRKYLALMKKIEKEVPLDEKEEFLETLQDNAERSLNEYLTKDN